MVSLGVLLKANFTRMRKHHTIGELCGSETAYERQFPLEAV